MSDLLIASQHNLVDEALNTLINQYAFDIVAANLGLVVNRRRIDQPYSIAVLFSGKRPLRL
jgi:hypothetical protein